MKGWCTDQQEGGTAKLCGKETQSLVLKRCLSISNSVQFSAAELLSYPCALPDVKKASGGGGERRNKGTTDISAWLLSQRNKGNVRENTVSSSFDYIPLIKVPKGSTHQEWGSMLGLVTSTFLTSGGRWVLFFFLPFFCWFSSECTHTTYSS